MLFWLLGYPKQYKGVGRLIKRGFKGDYYICGNWLQSVIGQSEALKS